ncbi:MAG: hypothetical protein H0T46_20430 [Deltaproteobacteria bacterium]|nr:hypothetical protein [Deltaproteobacteria bacterium]
MKICISILFSSSASILALTGCVSDPEHCETNETSGCACADGSKSSPECPGTTFDGIYNVDTWTLNLASCDAEGRSIKDPQTPVFFVKYETFGKPNSPIGEYSALNVRKCSDLASCQRQYADDDTFHLGWASFQLGPDGWTDVWAHTGLHNGKCVGSVYGYRFMRQGSDGARIETRGGNDVTYAPDSQGRCTDDALLVADAALPCSKLEVMVGSLLEK